jgi:GTP diphosphokinase / guanosine-3',5'-bis(diphosphate) 3'-diphosphatase
VRPVSELTNVIHDYNPEANFVLIQQAYAYGARMHAEQRRADGSPYFTHPIEVALILAKLRLDDATIITALLHDTLEDTAATREDLVKEFGEEITLLIEGVTKLSKLEQRTFEEAQAENFRKLLIATAKDVRVILVKLADRLHNMQTIHNLRPDKQQRIARETLDTFSPLAGRMGMQSIRNDLEDLAFEALYPNARLSILRRFITLRKQQGETVVPEIVQRIKSLLDENGIQAQVTGREKKPYSIWRKIQEKHISFEQLSDIVGFRIVVSTIAECYQVLGIIHTRWSIVPGYFKDYISVPKPNGYRSIHTTIMNDRGQRLEIQIRTTDMDEVAETGVAAHWSYKDGSRTQNRFAVDPFSWLKRFVDGVTEGEGIPAEEFLENAKLEMFQDQIFCFTPNGRVVTLPREATVLDFAYAVHSEIGDTCVGATSNGMRIPLWTQVRNGQTIKIVRSEATQPKGAWLDFVVTGRAKTAIKRALRLQAQEHYIHLGRELVRHVFIKNEKELTENSLATAIKRLPYKTVSDLLEDVGRKNISGLDVLNAVYPGYKPPAGQQHHQPLPLEQSVEIRDRQDLVAAVRRIAPCCQPLPGERIVGILGNNRGLTIHAIDCTELASLEDDTDRWFDVRWEKDASKTATHLSMLSLVLTNKPGALGVITSLIGRMESNIFNLSMQERMNDFYELSLAIEVYDVRHLNKIISALEAEPIVNKVQRIRKDNKSDSLTDSHAKFNALVDVAIDHAEKIEHL